MRHIETMALIGQNPGVSNAQDLKFWDTTRYTNWQKELIGKTATYSDISIGMTGGNSTFRYLVRSTYHKESTVFRGNFSDRKASTFININSSFC